MNLAATTLDLGDVSLAVKPSEEHEWTLTTAQLAAGFGVSPSAIRNHKARHPSVLRENLHWLSATNRDAGNRALTMTVWTRRGAIRLGFILSTDRAREFCTRAEALVLRAEALTRDDAVAMAEALVEEDRRPESNGGFVERLTDTDGEVTVGVLAQTLGMGRTRLFKWLRKNRYLIREHGSNRPRQVYLNRGLFIVRYWKDAHGRQKPTPLVTGKGVAAISEHWARDHEPEGKT